MDLQKLLDEINVKKAAVQQLVAENKIDEAKQAKAELVAMQEKYDLLADLADDGKLVPQTNIIPAGAEGNNDVTEFINAARHRFMNYNKEGANSDGGYTVPEDIQTEIKKFREANFSLYSLVDSEDVKTNKGRRTYRTRASHTGFQKVNEAGAIPKKDGPTFGVLNYEINKYGGYLPVTDELLSDSDANIKATLTDWLKEEDVATRNSIVIAKFKTATNTTTIESIDDIKDVVNVTLGSKFAGLVKIVTNDDGFNWLDKLKKSANSNEYLLKPAQDQTKPNIRMLAVGSTNVEVFVAPNEILASEEVLSGQTVTGHDVPFFIGAPKEYCKIFDREKMSIKQSTEATIGTGNDKINAFEQDMTVFRALERLDCEKKDDAAMVYGKLRLGE